MVDRYVEHILTTQASGATRGWLGPAISDSAASSQNYWSKYPAVLAFESYAEAAAPQRTPWLAIDRPPRTFLPAFSSPGVTLKSLG